MTISIRNTSNNDIPLSISSPSNTITSHILIQTESGRLSDTSIRYNRIHDDFFNDYSYNYVQRCSIRPVLWILLLVLVSFSVVAIVMGEAISEAFPLDFKEGKGKLFMRGNGTTFHESALRLDVGDADEDIAAVVLVERNDTWDDDDVFSYPEESYQEIIDEHAGNDNLKTVLEHNINNSIAENFVLNVTKDEEEGTDAFLISNPSNSSYESESVSENITLIDQPIFLDHPIQPETYNKTETENFDRSFRWQ